MLKWMNVKRYSIQTVSKGGCSDQIGPGGRGSLSPATWRESQNKLRPLQMSRGIDFKLCRISQVPVALCNNLDSAWITSTTEPVNRKSNLCKAVTVPPTLRWSQAKPTITYQVRDCLFGGNIQAMLLGQYCQCCMEMNTHTQGTYSKMLISVVSRQWICKCLLRYFFSFFWIDKNSHV